MFSKTLASTLCLALILLLFFTLPASAIEDETLDLTLDQRAAALHLQSMQPLLEPDPVWADVDEDPFGDPEEEPEMYGLKMKSSRRAFIYSLLLPGAGQVYNGSTILKPILFLGLEAAGLYAYINFHGQGVDKRDEYEAFADQHWFYDGYFDEDSVFHGGYIQSLEDLYPSADWRYGDRAKWWDASLGDSVNTFSEHLDVWIDEVADSARPYKNHAYYENIGKYDQFQYGWDDTDYDPQVLDSISANRGVYLDMRDVANKKFSKAKTAMVLTIVNHLVSAFDAALSARRHNRQQDRLSNVSFKMRYVLYEGNPMPKLTMTYRY